MFVVGHWSLVKSLWRNRSSGPTQRRTTTVCQLRTGSCRLDLVSDEFPGRDIDPFFGSAVGQPVGELG